MYAMTDMYIFSKLNARAAYCLPRSIDLWCWVQRPVPSHPFDYYRVCALVCMLLVNCKYKGCLLEPCERVY